VVRQSEKRASQTNRCSLAVVFARRLLVLGARGTARAPFLGCLGVDGLHGARGLGLVLIIARSLATPIRAPRQRLHDEHILVQEFVEPILERTPERWNWNRLRAYQPTREAPLLADGQLLVLVRLHPHLAAVDAALMAPRRHGPMLWREHVGVADDAGAEKRHVRVALLLPGVEGHGAGAAHLQERRVSQERVNLPSRGLRRHFEPAHTEQMQELSRGVLISERLHLLLLSGTVAEQSARNAICRDSHVSHVMLTLDMGHL
jgi:hypothetical protein